MIATRTTLPQAPQDAPPTEGIVYFRLQSAVALSMLSVLRNGSKCGFHEFSGPT